jgi:two-component system chemotaxis sensor kinase CheA
MIDIQILQDYCNEARELLEEMDSNLLLIEREGAKPELLNNIFRAVHCIKGSAQYIGLERSSALTHGLENLLDRLREGMIELDPKITEFLFRSKDLISVLVNEVSTDHEEKSEIMAVIQELEAIVGKTSEIVPKAVLEQQDLADSPDEQDSGAVTEIARETAASVEPSAGDTAPDWLDHISDEQAEETVTDDSQMAETYDSVTEEEVFNHATIEQTSSHLLNIALYLDDLQDGVRPSEILDPLLETVSKVKESFSTASMTQPSAIVEDIENRLNLIEPSKERLAASEIDELRSLLNTLRVYYPEELFPLSEDGVMPARSDGATEPKEDVSPFVRELSTIPGLDPAVARQIERAGFFSKDELRGATLAALLNIPGITPSTAEAVFRYTEGAPGSSKPPPPPPPQRASDLSLLADVDDDLLREFEQVLDDAFSTKQAAELGSLRGGRAADLLQEVGVVGEDGDREIIEIFLGYGYEILDKLRPVVANIARHAVTAPEMLLCADWIKSIRSSSGYMDYRRLEAFLDEWHDKTLLASDHLDSLSDKDLLFMQENLAKFQDFLHGMEQILNPEIESPKTTFASVQEPAAIASQAAAPVSTYAVQATQVQPSETVRETRLRMPPAPPKEVDEEPMAVMTNLEAVEPAQQDIPVMPKERTSESSEFQEMLLERNAQESAVVRTMRVDSTKVDTLLNQVGELVVNRSYVERLSQNLKDFHRLLIAVGQAGRQVGKREIQSARELATKVGEASISLGRVANDIQEGVMKLRMLPIGQLFNRMPRLIRDLSRRVGKDVNLEVHGADTEVDKRVIEQIYNPLVHLVRNAVDHGIEDRETRKAVGKNEQGLLTLRAYTQGSQVVVDVEDDGAGINEAGVLEKAVTDGLIDQQSARSLSRHDIYNFLFLPGFSTSRTVTRTSGRGVGMDVVKKDVEKINGHVEIESWENKGTRVSIKIPLTLAIIQTLLIRTSDHIFAIPMAAVREIIRISPEDISSLEGFEVIKFREETVPVIRINEVFKLRNYTPTTDPRFLVLTTVGQSSLGLLVEELLGEQDVVIKPLGEHVFESRGLAGSTILGDGAIALVLDVTEIIEDVIATQRQFASQGAWQAGQSGRLEESQTRNF